MKKTYLFTIKDELSIYYPSKIIIDNYDETKWKGKNRLGQLTEEIIKENINNK